MGALPNVFHNYQAVDNVAASEKIAKAWGVEKLPQKPGYKMPTMLHKAGSGGTKILYCVGDNTVQTEPHMSKTIDELKALELLIVVDIFPNMTTEYAHVVLPDTSWGEEDGTFTNTERRVQRVRSAVKSPGQARSQWWMLQEISKRLGRDIGFTSAQAIWEDMRSSATSYAGITWERIDSIGLQWPVPTLEHPGTPFLHVSGKFTRGKGLFHDLAWRPPAEVADANYPFVLSTGRRLWHYHSGTQTRNSTGFDDIFPEELLEISPVDAQKLGVKNGDMVKASSRRGDITLKAWVSDRSPAGVVWCSFHFYEACGNVLTNSAYDTVTETAEYKACAINVTKVSDGETMGIAVPRQARP
jgi:formate dehydrogenase major subunit